MRVHTLSSLRRAALVVVAASIAFVTIGMVNAGPALADDDAPFVMEAFPHDDVESEFFNDFGNYRPGGRSHHGNDIFSDQMTPIRAVADGFIERARTSRLSGYTIMIRHAGNWETWYMHLNNDTPGTDDGRGGEAFAFAEGIEVGAFVTAGQVIGWVGDSGNAEYTQPHTHFELHHAGRIVNPYPYLRDAWERQIRIWTLAAEVA